MAEKLNLNTAKKAFKTEKKPLNGAEYFGYVTKALIKDNDESYVKQVARTETRYFEDEFVRRLEDGFEVITKIIENPRTFIREDAELVDIALAKRFSQTSIRHLSSHAHYIRKVDNKGNVTPSKILTVHNEQENATYENRFVMTLIRRAIDFINIRHKYIEEHGESNDTELLLLHNKTTINGVTFTIDTRIKRERPTEDEETGARNRDIIKRLDTLKDWYTSLGSSMFMKEMKDAKEVQSPIHMTNMLVKHPDYHKAYLLWEFIEEYAKLGIHYDVHESERKIDAAYYHSLSEGMTYTLLSMEDPGVFGIDMTKYGADKVEKIEPKTIFTLEDVDYDNGKFLYDLFPNEKWRLSHMTPLPDEAKQIRLDRENRIKDQKDKKPMVEQAILDDKDEKIYEGAKKRTQQKK